MFANLCSVCIHILYICTAGRVDYQSDVYGVTVMAEETSVEVSIAIFDDSIVDVNETFTADRSVPVAEAALGMSVSATDGTVYVELQDNGKQNPLHMHVIVGSPLVSSRLHPDLAYITFRDMSYQVTEGSGYVTVTLLVRCRWSSLLWLTSLVELLQVSEVVLLHFQRNLSQWCVYVSQLKWLLLVNKILVLIAPHFVFLFPL